MTEKLINVAVFWLPLLAGIILSGLGPSIRYGGDKITALWVAFVGSTYPASIIEGWSQDVTWRLPTRCARRFIEQEDTPSLLRFLGAANRH